MPARDVIIKQNKGLVVPLSLLTHGGRSIQISNNERVVVIPDDQFDEVAAALHAALRSEEPPPPLIGDES